MDLCSISSCLFYFSCLICCIKLAEIYTVCRTLKGIPCVKISTSEIMYNSSYKYHFVLLVLVKKNEFSAYWLNGKTANPA